MKLLWISLVTVLCGSLARSFIDSFSSLSVVEILEC